MNNVTIRFWDKLKGKYVVDGTYFADAECFVYKVIDCDYYGDHVIAPQASIEPHLFKNGERIA